MNRKADFFYKTNRFESIRITTRIESIRIANWNALPHTMWNSIYVTVRCPSVSLSVCVSHLLTVAGACSGFAAWRATCRKYRSIAGTPALSSKCGQCHVYSRHRRLNTDLFRISICKLVAR